MTTWVRTSIGKSEHFIGNLLAEVPLAGPDQRFSADTEGYAALMVAGASLSGSSAGADDRELEIVADELVSHDPDGVRVARVLRRTYDMLLDGQHTGRYRWDQLYKTEKTHFGTLVEIKLAA